MNEVAINIPTIIYGIGTLIVSFIGFLLMRSVNQLDRMMEQHATKIEAHDKDISRISDKLDSHKEVTELKFTSMQTNISQRLDAIEMSQKELKKVAQEIQTKLK